MGPTWGMGTLSNWLCNSAYSGHYWNLLFIRNKVCTTSQINCLNTIMSTSKRVGNIVLEWHTTLKCCKNSEDFNPMENRLQSCCYTTVITVSNYWNTKAFQTRHYKHWRTSAWLCCKQAALDSPPTQPQQCLVFSINPAAAAKSLQSCPTLCDPIDGSPPGSPVPGILQARTLEWVAISFSSAWK